MALKEIITNTVVKAIHEAGPNKKPSAQKNTEVREVAKEAVETMMDNPAVVNATNMEGLGRSRVAYGTSGGFFAAAAILYFKWKAQEYDEEFFLALGAMAFTLYGFLGRALNWATPMWSRLIGLFKKGEVPAT